MTLSCDYCDELHGLETIYHKIYGSRNRIVHETKSFIVFPCMGQLREGHLLVASKAHKNAIGMLDMEAIKELESLVSKITIFFRDIYNQDLLCFEHGVLDDNGVNGGCGIYHMHLHLIPADRQEFSSVVRLIQDDDANIVCSSQGLLDTCNCVATKKTYVFLSLFSKREEQTSFIVTSNNNFFESQYMRKIICKVFGKADWDWRQIKSPEFELINTLEKSHMFLDSTQLNKIPHL